MSHIQLRNYDNSWYHPGRSRSWQIAWFFAGSPLLRSPVIPSSKLRALVLRMFGAQVGERVVIKPGVQVKYPWNLKVGNDVWLGEACWIDNLAPVEIGNDVCISQGAYLCTGNHNWSDPYFALMTKPIHLEDGCWVGAKALISPGITLCTGSIAAAGSVVTKGIAPYEIHAGNPALFIRMRNIDTNEATAINRLAKHATA